MPVDDAPTLQSSLETADDGRPQGQAGGADDPTTWERTSGDPVALLRHLDVTGHFHRDSRAGRVFHAGRVSLRENAPTDSLHVVVDGNHLKAHVDGVSPLAVEPEGRSRYSVRRALAHNLAGMAMDFVWLLRGRQGDHSCVLDCEWISGASDASLESPDLLDPKTSAWSVQLEARVAGTLDEARLRTALAAVLGRDALERDPLEVVDCDDDDALQAARARLQSRAVAVSARPPLHVYLARHAAGDVLMLNLNHAAADGVGALRVLQSIAGAYAGDAEAHAPLDFLATRELPVRPASVSRTVLAQVRKRAVERLRDMPAPPGQLAADEATDDPGCGFHHLALTAEQTRQVGVERSGADRNVLMAALHLTIGEWNLQHGTPGGRIGVLVPANLRPPQWRANAIGNISVSARVSTRPGERAGPASALKAVSEQIARNKRNRTGTALIAALERAGMLALWAKQSIVVLQPLTGNEHVDTATLCNLGPMEEAPSFGPDRGETLELWFSTPARSPGSLCIGPVTVGGRLHLTLRYPQRLFGPDGARRFAECYVEQLRVVAGAGA